MSETPPPEAAGFRETFLVRFRPGDQECLGHLTVMLDELTEQAPHWPQPDDSPTKQSYEAALEDLRYLTRYLDHVSEDLGRTQLDGDDLRRSLRAGELAAELRVLIGKYDV